MMSRCPFRRDVGSPQVSDALSLPKGTQSFSTQPPDLRRLTLDHKSFALACPLALAGRPLYPILVHRLMDSVRPSSPRFVASPQLGFSSLTVASSREDFHRQDHSPCWAHHKKPPPVVPGRGFKCDSSKRGVT